MDDTYLEACTMLVLRNFRPNTSGDSPVGSKLPVAQAMHCLVTREAWFCSRRVLTLLYSRGSTACSVVWINLPETFCGAAFSRNEL
jgi:hypothetical protein